MINLKKDRVLLKSVQEQGKIALPADFDAENPVLEVVAVGPEVDNCKVGDQVYVDSFATSDFMYDDEKYLLTRNENIIGTDE